VLVTVTTLVVLVQLGRVVKVEQHIQVVVTQPAEGVVVTHRLVETHQILKVVTVVMDSLSAAGL
jgi:hypothetical protein